MQIFRSIQKAFATEDWIGLAITGTLLSLWLGSFFELINIATASYSWVWLAVMILGRTYLHTGLFIIAHDSMHGNLIPNSKKLNNLLGGIALAIYGFLPYKHCRINHAKHHRYPSQSGDPDFHGKISHPIAWYCKFIVEYFPWRSLIYFWLNMSVIFWGAILLLKVPTINLVLFWLLPLCLSSLQLFFFGTYLPHRQVELNPNFLPRLNSNSWSRLWSFVSCYNFGHYHWEHHQYPDTPWYRLTKVHNTN